MNTNLLIQWRDNLIKLQEEGSITPEQKKNLVKIEERLKELGHE